MDMHQSNLGKSTPWACPLSRPLPLSWRRMALAALSAGWLGMAGLAAAQQAPAAPLQAPLQSPVNDTRQPHNTSREAPAPLGEARAAPTTGAASAAPGEPAPLASLASVGSDYRIGANDLLEFDVFGVPDMKRTVRVNSTGVVSLPLLGGVPLAGLTAQQAEALIAQKYGEKYLRNPQVSLFIKEFTTQRITIEGAVNKPGIYPVTGQLTLLRALALAGGGAQYAELREIMIYRNDVNGRQVSQMFDLEKVRAGEVPDPTIQSDDVIVVKRNASRTALRDSLFRDIVDTLNPFSK